MALSDTRQQSPPSRGGNAGWRYNAFISHSWADDNDLAQALRRDLQRLGKPIFSRRARSVFLDTAELAADPSLWGRLRGVLDGSEWLIFLASPSAAKPDAYIAQEVEYWVATKGTSRVLVALVDGAIEWDRTTKSFDRQATSALPDCLLNSLEGPLYVNLTEFRDRKDLTLEIPDWKGKVAELAAPLAGPDVTKSDLIDEDLTIQRKRRRLRNGAIAALVALAITASGAGILAMQNADEARRQRDTAELRRQEAVARHLSAQSLASLDSDFDVSLLLATEAASVAAPLSAATDALLRGVYGRPELVGYLRGHETGVLASAFDPTETVVNSISIDGWIHQWDLATGIGSRVARMLPTIEATFSGDGTTLAAETGDRTVAIVSTDSWQEVVAPRVGPPGNVTAIGLAVNGDAIAIGGSTGEAVVYSLPGIDESALHLKLHDGAIHDIALQPGGSLVASAGDDGNVVVADLSTGDVVRVLRPGSFKLKAEQPLYAVAFTNDGSQIAAGGFDELLFVWDARSGAELLAPHQGHNGTISAIDFDSSGTTVATAGYDEDVIVWDLTTGEQTVLKGHGDVPWDVSFSPNDEMLISAGLDHTAILWQVVGARNGATRIPVGKMVVTWVDDETLLTVDGRTPVLFDISSEQVLSKMDEIPSGGTTDSPTWAMDFANANGLVVTGGLSGNVAVHDTATGDLLASKALHAWTRGIAVSPDGTLVATVGIEGVVRVAALPDLAEIWHAEEGRELHGVAIDSAGATMATFGDGGAQIYQLSSGDLVKQIAASVVAGDGVFSPDNNWMVLAGSNGEIEVRGADTGELRLDPLTGHTDLVTDVAWSPSSAFLASASYDDSVRIWDANTGWPIGPALLAHSDDVANVAFSPNGEAVASAGLDGIFVWRLDHRTLSVTACAIAGRLLTPAEWTALIDSIEPYQPYCTQDLASRLNPRLGSEILYDATEARTDFDVWYESQDMDSLLVDMDAMWNTLMDAAAAQVTGDGGATGLIEACQTTLESGTLDRFGDALAGAPDEILVDAGSRFVEGLSRALRLCTAQDPGVTAVLLETIPAAEEFNQRMLELIVGDRGVRTID